MKRLIGILLCCALLCAAALAEGEGWTLDFDPNEAGYDGGWIGCVRQNSMALLLLLCTLMAPSAQTMDVRVYYLIVTMVFGR